MAAKQGLSAQISQASEDAKRAVLNRTSLTTSLWFSNLNTTCTIKSAPPRTPEVLSLLSTKSGWLFKRNEQHVWQTRWCCVVPHTFLYYFDANVLPDAAQPPVPSALQQEDWNQAVANGYPHRGNKKSVPRSSLYFLPSAHNNNNHNHDDHDCTSPHNGGNTIIPPTTPGPAQQPPGGVADSSFASMQPAGIIDLECYTSVHRSAQNQLVLELAGDDAVNPDLRQFYFSAGSEQETEAWTQALLGQRHTALMDETDAYKQVCDGFAQQLQVLHMEMDRFQKLAEDAQEELYQVRSETEDGRRSCWKMVEQVLDRQQAQAQAQAAAANGDNGNNDPTSQSQSFRSELDAIRSQDISLLAPVQLLSDYTRVLEDSCTELQSQNKKLQETLAKDRDSDQDQVALLQNELEETRSELLRTQNQWSHEKQVLQQKCDARQKEMEDLRKELASTRMEVTMYQSSTRNKIAELQNHKKILKKEVLDLRQKLEDAQSELSLVRHQEKSHRLEVDQERKKAELLERYVDKMESQVKVQQNMMEMMSAAGSVHGGGHSVVHGGGMIGSGGPFEVTVPHNVHSPNTYHGSRNQVLLDISGKDSTKPSINIHDDDGNNPGIQMPTIPGSGGPGVVGKHDGNGAGAGGGDDDGLVVHGHHHHYPLASSPLFNRRGGGVADDSDNKSHMSELTEDRTQKQFDALQYLRETRELRDRELGVEDGGRPSAGTGTGTTSINARMLRYSSQLSPSPRGNGTPPVYILGGGGGASTSLHQQQLLQNFQNPENAKLETINSSATAVTTPNRLVLPPENLPRSTSGGSRTLQSQPPHHVTVDNNNGLVVNNGNNNNTSSGSRSLGAGTPGRLSVAQRARLQAERGSTTPLKIRLDSDSTTKQLIEQQQHKQQASSPGLSTIASPLVSSASPARSSASSTAGNRRGGVERRTSNSSKSATGGGFFSNIGRKLEAAIDKSVFSVDVHVRSDDDDESDDDDDDLSSSGGSSRGGGGADHDLIEQERDNASGERYEKQKPAAGGAVLMTNANLDGAFDGPIITRRDTAPSSPRRMSTGAYDVVSSSSASAFADEKKTDEKKTPTPDRVIKRQLSLKERQELQRAKQLQFLKDQGLIKNEDDMPLKGGAGAGSPSFDAGSVTSTHISSTAGPADSSISFPGSSPPRSIGSRMLRS